MASTYSRTPNGQGAGVARSDPGREVDDGRWAGFGKQNGRFGMNRKRGERARDCVDADPEKGVDPSRQRDGGHGSRNPLRSV